MVASFFVSVMISLLNIPFDLSFDAMFTMVLVLWYIGCAHYVALLFSCFVWSPWSLSLLPSSSAYSLSFSSSPTWASVIRNSSSNPVSTCTDTLCHFTIFGESILLLCSMLANDWKFWNTLVSFGLGYLPLRHHSLSLFGWSTLNASKHIKNLLNKANHLSIFPHACHFIMYMYTMHSYVTQRRHFMIAWLRGIY